MREELVKRIAALLNVPGMNKVLLAHLAGINRNTLDGYDSEGWNPTIGTLDPLMKAVEGMENILKKKEG